MKKLTDKIFDLNDIQIELKDKDRVVVFTNGVFDIIHLGHVQYLHEAKEKGDILIVGVNSDASVKRLKGNLRPIQKEDDRMIILAALESVDYVIPFSEDTPFNLIKAITPDILIKGGDYKIEDIIGGDWVTSQGGRVTTIEFTDDHSTSDIIQKIKQS